MILLRSVVTYLMLVAALSVRVASAQTPDLIWTFALPEVGAGGTPSEPVRPLRITPRSTEAGILVHLGSTQLVDEIVIEARAEGRFISSIFNVLGERDIRSDPLKLLIVRSSAYSPSVPLHITLLGYVRQEGAPGHLVVTASAIFNWPPDDGPNIIRYLVMTEGFRDWDLDGFSPCQYGRQYRPEANPEPGQASVEGIGATELLPNNVCGDCDDTDPSKFRPEDCDPVLTGPYELPQPSSED